jgi:hypothetical protein
VHGKRNKQLEQHLLNRNKFFMVINYDIMREVQPKPVGGLAQLETITTGILADALLKHTLVYPNWAPASATVPTAHAHHHPT